MICNVNMTLIEFHNIATTLPHLPGIYKYYDVNGKLIYVGKANNLRKRISSYFNKNITGYKTHELVRRIVRIEFTIVSSEQDAFLLENSLIKEYQPLFNINLKTNHCRNGVTSLKIRIVETLYMYGYFCKLEVFLDL